MAIFPFTGGSHSTTSTEWSMPAGANYSAGSPQTTKGWVQVLVDVAPLVAGDSVTLRIYEQINAGTQAVALEAVLVPSAQHYVTIPLLLGEGWDATLKLLTGTARTLGYSVRIENGDVNATITGGATAAALTTAQADLTTLIARLTATRAGLLDNLDAAMSSRAAAAALTAAQTDLTTLVGRLTLVRAGLLDNLDAVISGRASSSALTTAQTDLTTLISRLTSGRATGLDNLDATLSSRATAAALTTAQADLTTLTGRLTSIRAGLIDFLDATTSSRASASAVAALPTTGSIAAIATSIATLATSAAVAALATSIAALPTSTQNRDAILAFAFRTGRTVRGHLRRMDALFFGKATGLLGVLAELYRPGGVTLEFDADQDLVAGTRDEVDCAASEVP